jgi:hypothetical protein
MPNYVSKDGVWYPAKEHVVLPHLTGTKNEVYDGPDRAAEFELAQVHGIDEDGKPKVTTFGEDFRMNAEMIEVARKFGFQDTVDAEGNVTVSAVEKYAKARGYDPKKSEKLFKEKAEVIVKHAEPERKPEPLIMGGGQSTAPGNEMLIGGFGERRVRPASEITDKPEKKK